MPTKMGYERKPKARHDNKLRVRAQRHFDYTAPLYHDDPIRWTCWCGSTTSLYGLDDASLENFVRWLGRHAACGAAQEHGEETDDARNE